MSEGERLTELGKELTKIFHSYRNQIFLLVEKHVEAEATNQETEIKEKGIREHFAGECKRVVERGYYSQGLGYSI